MTKNSIIKIVSGLLLLFFSLPLYAWKSHFLITYAALQKMPEVSQVPSVPAETLSSFLTAEAYVLPGKFEHIDEWPRVMKAHHIPAPSEEIQAQWNTYPTVPAYLAFRGVNDPARSLLKQFTDRARINPDLKYDNLFVESFGLKDRLDPTPLSKEDFIFSEIIKDYAADFTYQKVNPGQLVSPFEIITSAVDEPDYGMDVDVWSDNGTEYGNSYLWGNQPFGNARLAFSSQAPFHMGFFYESAKNYYFASLLRRTYPEFRLHFYLELSRYAFATKHPYWGYRFLGWALHYAQDLTQPYHSTAAPNVPDDRLILVNTFGYSIKHDLIQVISNKHLALENYGYNMLKTVLNQAADNAFVSALQDTANDKKYAAIAYDELYLREVIAKESHDKARLVDNLVANAFPEHVQPKYIFNVTDPAVNLYSSANQDDPNIQSLNNELMELFRTVGSQTRKIVKYTIPAV